MRRPRLRPAPAPRRPLIAIESSDIQPDASREAFFTLHVTLRNRADYRPGPPPPRSHPHRRPRQGPRPAVLKPAQWLPADAPKDAFPAQREIATQVAFEAPGVAAAGYRV